MTLQSCFSVYMQRKTRSEKIHVPQCSSQHCLKQPRHGGNLNVHQQRNGYRRRGMYIQWNVTQPLKRMKQPFAATWTDPESVILSEGSQRRKNIIWRPLHGASKKKWHKWAYKTETDLQPREQTHGCWQREDGEGIVRESGMDVYSLLHLKWTTNRAPHIAQGTLPHAMLQPGWEGSMGENGYASYMHSWGPSLFT